MNGRERSRPAHLHARRISRKVRDHFTEIMCYVKISYLQIHVLVQEISLTDTILRSIELKQCFTTINCEQKLNQTVDTSDCERSEARALKGVLAERREAPFTIYSLTIRIMCYVKVWKYLIAICLLVLRKGFFIQAAILVKDLHVKWFPWNKNTRKQKYHGALLLAMYVCISFRISCGIYIS